MRNKVCTILVCALLCLAPTANWADLAPYSQNFEGLDQADPGALSNDPAPSPNGWLIFGNVFGPAWGYWYGYGPYPAPNGGPGFSAIASGTGGPKQGAQQLVVYSDYNNGNQGDGSNAIIEANVFQERTVGAADIGSTWHFEFDARRGDIGGGSMAAGFIKTINPAAGYALTNFLQVSMTGIPNAWGSYSLSILIDPSLEGQLLQFGFINWASNYEPSGIYYDNVGFRPEPRSVGFWTHQCRGLGFKQVSSQELNNLFADVALNSDAFPECVPIDCSVLDFDPPLNEMRTKAERQTLALWLNMASGRMLSFTPIDLPGLTSATRAGDAIAEIETTLCDPGAGQSDLETAKDIAEALNAGSEDMELASTTSSMKVSAGETVMITLGLINMSPDARDYSLTTTGSWPVSLSHQLVSGLGSGQVAVVTANVDVPASVSRGQKAQIQVTAQDMFSGLGLQSEAVIDLEVRGQGGGGKGGSKHVFQNVPDKE
jgi:hypothetical protein